MKLETQRMTYRPFTAEDWRDLRLIHGDARATDTLSADGVPFADEKSRTAAETWAAHWQAHDFGHWHISDKVSGGFCAYAGLRFVLLDGAPIVELAYAVVPAFWRQGRGHEFARACVDDVFNRTALTEAWCFTLTRNTASRKVMQGAGFQYSHDGERVGLPHVFCKLTRSQWEAGRDA